MKNFCLKLGGISAFLICLPIMWRISKGDQFNALSFLLWSFMSLICTIVLIRAKKGGQTMMIAYIFSDLSIGLFSLFKGGKLEFGNFEIFIIILSVVCISIYAVCEIKGNLTPAVIVNAFAILFAGIPYVMDSFKQPHQTNLVICWIYMGISALCYYGERPTMNARLMPVLSIVYWVVIIVGVLIVRR